MAYKQKASGGLARLPGLHVRRRPDLPHVWYDRSALRALGLERGDACGPFAAGTDEAEICAAWTERDRSGDRVVKIAAVAKDGTVGEFYLTHVLLDVPPAPKDDRARAACARIVAGLWAWWKEGDAPVSPSAHLTGSGKTIREDVADAYEGLR